jgi:NDP-sugar pyrophosphorylase family protein
MIPLGGIGNRFKTNNYTYPKALIKVLGRPIIYWLLDSLKNNTNDIIYIAYNKQYTNYRFVDILKNHKFFTNGVRCLKENILIT